VARAADGRLCVTAGAAVEVEARPQTLVDIVDLAKRIGGGVEELELIGRDSNDRPAGVWRAAPHARVVGQEWQGLRLHKLPRNGKQKAQQ